ncbi:hypothetical protein [Brevundimonas goettingensis]|uniref:Uncharacterized protein n=1 Tax=Brevundimonas goettingensis TaxID=2774190 RepID=A0A975GWR0_9CAUL|nr:hypothetical protein [Brevundimonas goettingensis]QTC92079.1 hypothetical protein IFJ75_03980 [Brevundimonas goettingensis]
MARSQLFRSSLVTVYGIGLVLCLLTIAGAVAMPRAPSRWAVVAAFTAAAAVIVWRLWLYRRTYVTGGRPPARRLLLVFLPRAVLAVVGLVLALAGVGYIIISFALVRAPGFQETESGSTQTMMCVIGGVLALVGGLFLTPLILALRGRRSPDSAPETPLDPASPSQDVSAT